MNWIIERLKEPSTWRGIILILTGGTSAAVDPGMIAETVTAGLTLAGIVGTVTRDK